MNPQLEHIFCIKVSAIIFGIHFEYMYNSPITSATSHDF